MRDHAASKGVSPVAKHYDSPLKIDLAKDNLSLLKSRNRPKMMNFT